MYDSQSKGGVGGSPLIMLHWAEGDRRRRAVPIGRANTFKRLLTSVRIRQLFTFGLRGETN